MHRSKIRWEVGTTRQVDRVACFKYHNHYQLAAGEIFHFVVKSVIFSICSFKCTLFCNALLQFKGGNLRLEANRWSSSSKKPIASLVFIDSYYIRTKSMQLRLKISCCFSICKRNHQIQASPIEQIKCLNVFGILCTKIPSLCCYNET